MNEKSEVFLDPKVVQEIIEDRTCTTVNVELGILVDQGLLEMGVTEDGDALYWPTPKGAEVLGMELA